VVRPPSFRYQVGYWFRLIDASICGASIEADTQFSIFDSSASEKQLLIFGKTMLAKRLPSILPSITFQEAIETSKIFSEVGMMEKDQALIIRRPFRSPHHTISDAGLIGGGHRCRTFR
jgi:predicted ATPase with chaperone activity